MSLKRSIVVVAIHHTTPVDAGLSFRTRLLARVCGHLSKFGAAVVYVTETSRIAHRRAGFRSGADLVIPIGVRGSNSGVMRTRQQVRSDYSIPEDGIVIIHLARLHPDKDQWNLMRAFAQAQHLEPRLHLIAAGRDLTTDNPIVAKGLADNSISTGFTFLGEISETTSLLESGDLFCLSSRTEAQPLSLVEALQCGLVPVVTDVGECARMVAPVGVVVRPRDSDALALGLVRASKMLSEHSRESARKRGQDFGLDKMVAAYSDLYQSVARCSAGSD